MVAIKDHDHMVSMDGKHEVHETNTSSVIFFSKP